MRRFFSTVVRRVNQGGGAGRVYRVSGSGASGSVETLLPSVTTVLNVLEKAALLPWAIRVCLEEVRQGIARQRSRGDGLPPDDFLEKLLARAANAPDAIKNSSAAFGTRAHAAIDAIITGVQPRPPVPPDIAAVVAGFEAWYSSSGIRFAPAGDTMVYSRLHGYAGAADCIGYRLDGSAIVVCDFKTSNSTQQSYAFQLAAYAVAIREMWAAGELDLNTLLAADPHISTTPTDGVGDSAADPSSTASASPFRRVHTETVAPSVDVSLTAPVFDPLAIGGQDPFFAALAAAAAASSGSVADPARDSCSSAAPVLTPSAPSAKKPKETLVSRKASPALSASARRSKRRDDADDSHPIVDEEFLLGAIAAADASVAASHVGAIYGSTQLVPLPGPPSRGFSTLAGGVKTVIEVSDEAPANGLLEVPNEAPVSGAAGDVRRLSFCPLTTPIEAIIVRLDKATGAVDVQRVVDVDAAFGGFLAALQLHKLLKPPRATAQQRARDAAAADVPPAPQHLPLLERVY